jgi:Variant SH3 domain
MHRTDIEYSEIVKVLHDYSPTEQGCLSLKKGDLIYVQTKAENGWWMGIRGNDAGTFVVGLLIGSWPN